MTAGVPVLRLPKAAERLGVSVGTLRRERKKQGFPLARKITDHTIGFEQAELDHWWESRERVQFMPRRGVKHG